VAKLHEVVLRGAFHELSRRRGQLRSASGPEFDDLAHQAANDALMNILKRLDDFRGSSRFTTWAYKFVLLETAVRLRRRAWEGREVVLEPERWPAIADPAASPHELAVARERLAMLQRGVEEVLTPHQREVFAALALNGVPIDVLAERLGSTRGALYKTLHDARRKLRAHLEGSL
jgi:RNA polymerase sigma-70 factor, ECF subfamily